MILFCSVGNTLFNATLLNSTTSNKQTEVCKVIDKIDRQS